MDHINPSVKYLADLPKAKKLEIAAKIGRKPLYVNQIVRGRIPGRNTAILLEWVCEGRVRADDWDEAIKRNLKAKLETNTDHTPSIKR